MGAPGLFKEGEKDARRGAAPVALIPSRHLARAKRINGQESCGALMMAPCSSMVCVCQ